MLNLLKSDEKTGLRNPVLKSSGTLSDIRYFFLNKPKIDTLIRFKTESDRQNYSQRILQRLGMKVTDYSILNIHQIGIQVPVRYVFEELLKWNGDSTCWPNYLAKVVRIEDRLENIQIFLFGRTKYPFGLKKGPFGLHFVPLFNLNAIKFQRLPDPHDFDNARYLLFESSGGYPIGIFSIYMRSSIADQGETDQTQLFFIVGFNFYGKKNWNRKHIVNRMWELVHDRVTANVMNRFKQLCEWQFQMIQNGE